MPTPWNIRFLTVIGSLLLTSMAAFEFALFEFPGKKILFGIVLVALMIPTAVTLVPTYLLVAKLGWVNKMQGLVVPGSGLRIWALHAHPVL